jgi:hypothetical protein
MARLAREGSEALQARIAALEAKLEQGGTSSGGVPQVDTYQGGTPQGALASGDPSQGGTSSGLTS